MPIPLEASGHHGPGQGDSGFDCSGLTKAAYTSAHINLPHTAQAQFDAGTNVPKGQPLLPGDLVFYGSKRAIHHVGLYTGNGQMINASRPGRTIRIEPYRYRGDNYAGARRVPSAPKSA